jgi:glycosyltransferase involved in cell wall biosynthesis
VVETGVPVSLESHVSGASRSTTRLTPEVERLPRGRRYPIDLLLLNVNEMIAVPEAWLRAPTPAHYVIGAWFWELSALPDAISEQTVRVDEIWVGSKFVRNAFRAVTRTPVAIVPPAVEVEVPVGFDATHYGVRRDAVVYFFNFDALSTAARKNPWGVIDAFARAFTPAERAHDVQLVVKVHNLERASPLARPLRDAINAVDGLLMNVELRRGEMNGLLDRADVYVSLHRSEGFGLGLAEAMYLGTPVIATAYSGNMDFTTAGSSCLVGYSMRRVQALDHEHYPQAETLYRSGLVWADPDLDLAARWMRLLYEHPEVRAEIGGRAAAAIRRGYSPSVQVEAIAARLDQIARSLA